MRMSITEWSDIESEQMNCPVVKMKRVMSITEWSDIESEQMNCPVVKMKRVMMRTSLPGARLCRWREAAGLYIGKKH